MGAMREMTLTIETNGGLGVKFAHTYNVLWCSTVVPERNGEIAGLKVYDEIHAVRSADTPEWFIHKNSHELLKNIRSLIRAKEPIAVRVRRPSPSPGRRLIERLVYESEQCIRS